MNPTQTRHENTPNSIVVIGAGAAGMACALSAAAQGMQVVLLEQSAHIGGTVAQALIHTLGGLYDDQGELLNTGLAAELTDRLLQASTTTQKRRIGKTWTLSVDPTLYTQVVNDWIHAYPNIDVRCHATVTDLSVTAKRIDKITITQTGSAMSLHPQILIDATGQAAVVRQIDASLVTAGIALSGLILQLRGVVPNAIQFPKGVALLRRIRKASENQVLPPECATLWLDKGVYPDEVYVKFNLLHSDYDATHMAQVAAQLLIFLQALPDFADAVIHTYGQLGIRDAGQVCGAYTLTETDLKQGQPFTDAVCKGCWPIEFWHPQQGVSLDYFLPGHRYEIPLRALKVKGFDNLFVAGKCLSAEPRAQASTRVVGTCWAMGDGLVKALIKEDMQTCQPI